MLRKLHNNVITRASNLVTRDSQRLGAPKSYFVKSVAAESKKFLVPCLLVP